MSPAAFFDAASGWALSPGYRRTQPDVRPPTVHDSSRAAHVGGSGTHAPLAEGRAPSAGVAGNRIIASPTRPSDHHTGREGAGDRRHDRHGSEAA